MKLAIHCANVTGLGAADVALSILHAFDRQVLPYDHVKCYVPANGKLASFSPVSATFRVIKVSRWLPNAISRTAECFLADYFYDLSDHAVVLGDIPLRSRSKQVVLIHQAHLQLPKVNPHASGRLAFRMMRMFVRMNSRYVKSIFVQSEAMRNGLLASYEDWRERDCIRTVCHPPPAGFDKNPRPPSRAQPSQGLRLFYPAALYPHKNHVILARLLDIAPSSLISEIKVTVQQSAFIRERVKLHCLGRLSREACVGHYYSADAVVFPSFIESYGLPLVEAMTLGIPIVVSDLPYARTLCGSQAIYFDPMSPESLYLACKVLQERIAVGWRPDWTNALQALSGTWDDVAACFLRELAR